MPASLYAGTEPFDVELMEIDRFPAHVWLAPGPRQRFMDLIEMTVGRFPNYPPYGGAFQEHIPHVTIASGGYPVDQLEAARLELAERLPIRDRAEAVTLFEKRDAPWHARASFRLGSR
jgi:2'-5' RNA ligase